MLAIISDLHIQETRFDCVRYREGGVLKQIGVRRNVKAADFKRLVVRLHEAARQRKSEEIHLVFAGDLFELHRAPAWFFGPDNHVRPTDSVGEDVPQNPLRRKVHEILTQLEDDEDHRELWRAIRAFVGHRATRRLRVTIHYVPGNHDRLANAWPSVRQRVRRMLGMDDAITEPFPVRLDFTGPAPADYGVRIRHGHEYDPPNFAWSTSALTALDRGWEDYLRPAFGDYLTVDVAMRLALAFRARYALALRGAVTPRERLPTPDQFRRLYLALTEFDDVRPASLLTEYLAERMGPERQGVFEALRPILRDAIETAVADRFFMAEASKHLNPLLIKVLPDLVKNLTAPMLEEIVRTLSKSPDEDADEPARRACVEFRHGSGFGLVISGHTHRPEQVPLAGGAVPQNAEAFYLNSGTWRTILPHGIGGFGRLRASTMVLCYNSREQQAGPEDRRTFEIWTGYLAAGTLGPYDEVVERHSRALAGIRQLLFESLEPIAVEKEIDGAELRVTFGVDDHGYQQEFKGIRAGDAPRRIVTPALALDPNLDGDLWFHGLEVDWGNSPLNYDDPLPWALEPLPRDGPHGQFRRGRHALRILGCGVGGADRTELVLRYRID